jgi:hypothetical protein
MKRKLEKDIKEIESIIIPEYMMKKKVTDSKVLITMTEFGKMEKEKERHIEFWHQEVDTIFDSILQQCVSSN